MMGLTPVQRNLLAFLSSYIAESGHAPSYDEMIQALGFASKSRAFNLINNLEERGYIRRLKGKSRSIEVISQSEAQNARDFDIGALDSGALTMLRADIDCELKRREAA